MIPHELSAIIPPYVPWNVSHYSDILYRLVYEQLYMDMATIRTPIRGRINTLLRNIEEHISRYIYDEN